MTRTALIRGFACLSALLCALAVSAQPAEVALTGRTTQGERVDLKALHGKVVLVFFWSTDCPVCLDKMPEFRRNLEGWRGKDFVIVAVNQDRSMDDLKRYEQVLDTFRPREPQIKMVWRSDPAHRDNLGALPLNAPTSLLLDRQGAVVRQVRGRIAPELWNDIAELVLN